MELLAFIFLVFLFQVALIVHLLQTQQSSLWFWTVLLLPLLGALAYLTLEWFPNQLRQRTIINSQLSEPDALHEAINLAEDLLQKGQTNDALKVFRNCYLRHPSEFDVVNGLAKSEFELGHFNQTKKWRQELAKLPTKDPKPSSHLLYARTLEQLGELEAAVEEYQMLNTYMDSPEPIYRLAMLQKKLGQCTQADELFAHILDQAKHSDATFKQQNHEWIHKARMEIQSATQETS